jgi:hypothetical protein
LKRQFFISDIPAGFPAHAFGAVPVGTGKAAVDGKLYYFAPEPALKVRTY